jgi:hypothetical protein
MNDFDNLVRAAKTWAEIHMDQWEKFKFLDRDGNMVYVSIRLEEAYPDTFDLVRANGGA